MRRLFAVVLLTVTAHGADFFAPDTAIWRLWRGNAEASKPIDAWRQIGFNDSAWELAPAPVYYSTADTEPPFYLGGAFQGTRLNDMQNHYTCVFLRQTFNVPRVTNIEELTLHAACDDGFIAWINGHEVARYNVPDGELGFDATAFDSPSEPVPFLDFPISQPSKWLVDGTNVIAVQGFNRALESSDFGFMAGLSSTVPLPPLDDTKFDHDRGFYLEAFELAITCATPGATIYYTVDGSSPSSTNGQVFASPVLIRGTTVVRARAEKSGFKPSNIDTHTYLFLSDVINQSTQGAAPPGWPSTWGGNKVDYGMDPDIAQHAPWNSQIQSALRAIPSLSLVTDFSNLFDADSGIYANAGNEGRAWERPCSLEYLEPKGTNGFQENCGIRIRGGFSRSSDDPKHSFRFYFRSEYGATKLHYPLFGATGGKTFDQFDLRTSQDGSWAYTGARDGFFLNDPFARDTLLALGQPGERGDFVHLYINGQYWGLYNTCERPEASFAATYFGGEPEDYDVLKPDPQSNYVMTVTDGNDLAWTALWRAATNGFTANEDYFAVQGRDPDGAFNPARTNLLDVVNLIDYLLTIIWTGDYDGPIYGDLNDGFLNNYYAFRSRQNTGGFRFVTHDAELSLGDVNENRAGTSTRGDPARGDGPDRLNPYYLWTQLRANPEFKLLVADRIQKHFLNGGALSTEACTARFKARQNEIALAVIGESARWGDAQHPNDPITPLDWTDAIADKLQNYFPKRAAIVLKQLRSQNLWTTSVGAPSFSSWGGELAAGATLSVTHTNKSGSILVTVDGSDPRRPRGAISASAFEYISPIPIDHNQTIRARAKAGDVWSPIVEGSFFLKQEFRDLHITEIMYHPPKLGETDGEQFEFIELENTGSTPLDLSGVHFTSGIQFAFTNGARVNPGQFIVLVRSPVDFAAKYPGIPTQGIYTGKLNNAGDTLTLNTASGAEILSFTYGDALPWPTLADGRGHSLVPIDPSQAGDLNDPAQWKASDYPGGSPGANDGPSDRPRLRVVRSEGGLVISWEQMEGGAVLESTDKLSSGGDWTATPLTLPPGGTQLRLTNGISGAARFYRLRKP